MCTNGVNTQQLKDTITQIDEAVALCRKWTHRAYHSADNAQFEQSAAKLAEAQAGLDEVRALFSDIQDVIDDEDAALPGVTVTSV
ncbi:MAG: hypothetical protein LBL67_01360 [Coriobacteriales bacterium]|jgi:hypothetical protein|nr:hypothetical protein [Coriobacteriales bacterium]